MDIVSYTKPKSCTSCGKYKLMFLFSLGVVGLLSGMFSQTIFTTILKKKLVLTNNSEVYQHWHSPPIPVYQKFYIFNYTNVEDIIKRSARPHVSQIGPFTYREVRINQVLNYNEYNITYIQNYTYVFEPSLSCSRCNEGTTVYVPNIALMSVLKDMHEKVKDPGWFVSFSVNTFLNNIKGTSLFKRLTVGQLIWGYEDDILKLLGNLEVVLNLFGFRLPKINVIQLQRNGTDFANDVGNLTILTGKENIDDVQKVVRWRGLDKAPYWNTKYANMINGSEGAQVPPFVLRNQRLYAFAPQLCRSFFFVYEKDLNYLGIPMYRFTPISKLNSANITVSPNSVEFCNDTETCLDGLLSVGTCQFGNPPIYMSSPHFYLADPKLVNRVSGLKPNKDLHGSFIDIEPTIGSTMRGYKRMQVNVMARKSFIDLTKVFEHDINFLPICFVEQVGVIDSRLAANFRKMVLLPKNVMKYGGIALMALGCVIILLSLYLLASRFYYERRQKKKVDESLEENEQVQKELLTAITTSDM